MDVFNVDEDVRLIHFLYRHVAMNMSQQHRLVLQPISSPYSQKKSDLSQMVADINASIRRIYSQKQPIEWFRAYFPTQLYYLIDADELSKKDCRHIKKCFLELFDWVSLPIGKYEWIENGGARAVDFCWFFIRTVTPEDLVAILKTKYPILDLSKTEAFRRGVGDFLSMPSGNYINKMPYYMMNLSEYPDGADGKVKQIKCFIDNLDYFFWNKFNSYEFDDFFSIPSSERKDVFIGFMHKVWQLTSSDNSMVRWIEKNKDRVDWAWGYFLDKFYNGNNPPWLKVEYKNNNKNNLLCFYDLLAFKNDKRNLFMAQLSKANSQQRYREKMANRKQVNIPLNTDVKTKLDKLAELQGKKMYEVVECLINKEFDGLFDKKSNDITQ